MTTYPSPFGKNLNLAGFTLIETIVVVLLIGIFAAIATPSYVSWYQTKKLDDALIQVDGAIREARHEAKESGQGCTVTINTGTGIISATTNSSTPSNCLPTGNRNLNNIASELRLSTDFISPSPKPLEFDYLNFSANEGVIVIYEPNTNRQRCLVVSAGPGLIRTGFYQGNPNNPTVSNCNRNQP